MRPINFAVVINQQISIRRLSASIERCFMTRNLSPNLVNLFYFTTVRITQALSEVGIEAKLIHISKIDKFFTRLRRLITDPSLLRVFKNFISILQ